MLTDSCYFTGYICTPHVAHSFVYLTLSLLYLSEAWRNKELQRNKKEKVVSVGKREEVLSVEKREPVLSVEKKEAVLSVGKKEKVLSVTERKEAVTREAGGKEMCRLNCKYFV